MVNQVLPMTTSFGPFFLDLDFEKYTPIRMQKGIAIEAPRIEVNHGMKEDI